MSIDSSLVERLNHWGELHVYLVRVSSNDLVYVVILLAALWLLASVLKAHPIQRGWKNFVKYLINKGVVIIAIPTGIAVLISESISAIYTRERPFVADSKVQLLVPHSADGGMPSHHVVFMATLVASIYFYHRGFAILLAGLTLISAIARVMAGIHYPSDILVGALLGVAIVYLYRRLIPARWLHFSQ